MTEITMPSLSDAMQEGTILSWLKQDGEQVQAGEELVEIETEKATMTHESPSAGGPGSGRHGDPSRAVWRDVHGLEPGGCSG